MLVGIGTDDTKEDADYICKKLINIRLWDSPTDAKKKWNQSVKDLDYELLLVSQFTLYCKLNGNKPDFHNAMKPDTSKAFFDAFVHQVKQEYKADKVQTGEFGAYMDVQIQNDGPGNA